MLGVKLTILLIVITVIWCTLARLMFQSKPYHERLRRQINADYPWYVIVCPFMIILDIIGIVYSVVYLLFLR